MPLLQKIITLAAVPAICLSNVCAQEVDALELPFFDDFSYNSQLPDKSLWDNAGVSISCTMPNRPPSIGAAVFDALDADGNFYPAQYGGKYANGDTLTSMPINLDYPGDNTIFLSFFYQPGGFGDDPEPEDMLMLDFYSPEDETWTTVEQFSGSACYDFKQAIIPIVQKCYLQKGFRFRFRNYFSLGSSKQADLVSNCDFWLVDYVKLDKMRSSTDTVYQDIALTNCPEVKFGHYMTIPWKHYSKVKDKLKVSYSVFYRNNDNEPRMLDSINMIIKNKNVSDTLMLGSYNLPSYLDFTETKQFKYNFEADNEKAEYQIGIQLVSDVTSEDFAPNNVYFSDKVLSDCYAYDDGSAEAGYGLHGEGSQGGMVAVKFAPLVTDNIKGVYIYFNPTFRNAQAEFFHLKIWSYKNGVPDSELYSDYNLSVPKQECGQFVFFPLKQAVSVSDTFFIGWQKTVNEILNVGFDKSTTNVSNNYYNTDGQWKKSANKGQIMIRPAFGALSTPIDDIDPVAELQTVSVMPNPAKDYIRVSGLPSGFSHRIYIIGVTGKTVKQLTLDDGEEIDISDIAPGVYFLKAEDADFSAKFLKIK